MHNGGLILKTLNGAAPAPPPPSHGAGGQSAPVRIDPLEALRLRPRLATAVFLAVALIGLLVAALRNAQRYSAELSIYVAPSYAKNLLGEQEVYAQYNTFLTQQMAVLGRYDILAAAIQKTEGKPYAWRKPGETERAAVDRFRRALDVRHLPDTYLIAASLEGDRKEGLAETLNGLAAVAVEQASNEGLLGRGGHLDALTSERADLQADIEKKNDDLSRLAGALGMVSIDKSSGNPEDTLLAGSRSDLEEARKRRMEADSQYAMIGGTGSANRAALLAMVDDKIASDAALNGALSVLNQKAAELKTSVLGMSATHPLRKAAEQQIAGIEAQMTALRKTARERAEAQIVDRSRGEMNRARAVEAQLEAQVRDRSGRVQGQSKQMQAAGDLQAAIDRDRSRVTALDERIDFLGSESTAPRPLRVFSAAQPPLNPLPGSRRKMLVLIFVLAVGLSLTLVVGLDALDAKVRDTSSVEQALGFTPTGLILESSPETKNFAAEHFLRLVSGIERARDAFQTRTIVFTSLRSGGGATRLTKEIGNELRSHGLRVLRIEANAHSGAALPPRGEKRTFPRGEKREALIDILSGKCAWKGAIRNGGARRPDWIPLGVTKGPNLPGSHRMRAVLEELEPLYDLILIDAPPLLLSADTEVLIGAADATMVVVRADADTRDTLRRANRLLRRLEPGAVGCVLNRVTLRRSSPALRREFAEYQSFRGDDLLPVPGKTALVPSGEPAVAADPAALGSAELLPHKTPVPVKVASRVNSFGIST